MATGYPGQPFNLRSQLPAGVSVEEFYALAAIVAAAIAGWWLYRTFGPHRKTAMRIRAIQERRFQLQGELLGPKRRRQHSDSSFTFMRAIANKWQLVKKLQIDKAEKMLVEAGLDPKDALPVMAFSAMVLPVVLGITGFICMKLLANPASKWAVLHYAWPVMGAYIGMKLPWIYIRRRRRKRYVNIQRSLADVLDLMTICAEAGLSLAAMIDRVGRELAISYPDMAEEMKMTSVEIGFMPDRNKALTNLSERVQIPEVRGIVSVLIQTEKYGTPIAQALRVLSNEFRQARMLRAEQKAAKLPAIMTIPMIVFILPTLFIVIIAPAAIRLSDTLGK